MRAQARHPGARPPPVRPARAPRGPADPAAHATPYDAVEKLEQWFVSSGTFRYSNHPPVLEPPLVGFVTRTHAGYCQYFAGAMALMLRYLGIPARVAVGFAGGTYDSKRARLERQRPRGACLGRGLVQGLRLAAVRPDAGRSRRRAARDAGRRAGGRWERAGRSATSPAGGTSPAARNAQIAEQKLRTVNGFGPQSALLPAPTRRR